MMKIYSVIVCYKPDIPNLERICKAILSCDTNVILVDNTENCYIENISNSLDVELIRLNENLGIAKAQNIGITLAMEKGAEIVVFFDQDSEIENDFIRKLTNNMCNNVPEVFSPVFYDKNIGFKFPSYRLNKFGLLKQFDVISDLKNYEVDVVISSGSAVSKITFDIVGLMNEDYFIDFVDTEWCLRCRAKGIPIRVLPTAIMKHSIGDKSVDLKFTRIFIHSSLRSYYKVRNSFLFFRSKHVPFLMGLKEIVSALVHNFLTVFIVADKWDYLKKYIQAIKDGILGRVGKKYNINTK
ncbi:glycosyltransferase family 2 protein [Flavobacterium sp. GSP27]|uniref:glycosyltransferase family 2 protein n=1 Tax=Flavobacterium sp. GSP27 TaxID=2497489 RepID=UPI000F81D634|nr:glycosyltransferase family 2 protein [Flavobacterium sp. GSP27]RTZ07236.1 glycosyltransferase family 2 protein [Flavobacterium sp. GSP27]